MNAALSDPDAPIVARLAAHEHKALLRFVVVGSVDDGKSTLIGRLLFEGQGLYDDQISAVRRASKQNGQEIDFSLFTDGLRAEREQGITIDVAYRYFATERRKYIVADTPGHAQYTRNMATGASTADVAVILLDARLGVLPQSRRHAFIASLLGIPRLVVAINKMDLLGFDRGVYERTARAFSEFVAPLGFRQVSFFPISATAGDNVVARSARTPWYAGPTLMQFLEEVPIGPGDAARPLRFPVQLVLRPHLDYRGFAGQLASGRVQVGDAVVALPSGQRSTVRAIDTFDGPLQQASAPQSVTLRLADEIDLGRGDVLVHAASAPRVARELEAHLVWLGDRPLDRARELVLKHTSRRVKARVAELGGRVNLETLAEEPAETLEKNDIGAVRIVCSQPIFADAYTENRATGAFVLIDARTNETVAAGVVRHAIVADGSAGAPVSADERRRRWGHGGAVLAAEDEETAVALERALFERGAVVARVGAAIAAGLAHSGALAIVVDTEAGPGGFEVRAGTPAHEVIQRLVQAGVLEP